jgi:hypothetical protein
VAFTFKATLTEGTKRALQEPPRLQFSDTITGQSYHCSHNTYTHTYTHTHKHTHTQVFNGSETLPNNELKNLSGSFVGPPCECDEEVCKLQ